MENSNLGLPDGVRADRDNLVYWDPQRRQFYWIEWKDLGNRDEATRHYIYQNPFYEIPQDR
jgi:hypothetical protein